MSGARVDLSRRCAFKVTKSRRSAGEMEDDGGAWMSEGAKVAEFLAWFTSEPEAEAPLKNIAMISSPSTGGPDKNTLRMVSKQFKDDAEEGTRSIKWKGPGNNGEEEDLPTPSSLWPLMVTRDKNGRLKDRLPNLKSIHCSGLDTLMDLNGCPIGLEELLCGDCTYVQNLAPLAACTNLRLLHLSNSSVTCLKPLMTCENLEWLSIEIPVSDIRPLSACTNLKVLYAYSSLISDLSPLSGLRQLELVSLWSSEVTDLSPLSSLLCLETLVCTDTAISDLTPLSKCSELKALCVRYTEVKSLAPLQMCKKLKWLNHGDFKGDQTDGYMECFKEQMPDLVCTDTDTLEWWESLPSLHR